MATARHLCAATLTLLALAGCSAGSPQLPEQPQSVTSLTPDAPAQAAGPEQTSMQINEWADVSASFARQGAVGQPVTDNLAGPGMFMSLGPVLTELRVSSSGTLPDTTFRWAGCSAGCPELTTRELLMQLAADLASDATNVGDTRAVGPQAASSDPRPETLQELPTLVAYREDTANARWRTWYVTFSPVDGGIVAVVGESGELPA